jgi:hypothetical protein
VVTTSTRELAARLTKYCAAVVMLCGVGAVAVAAPPQPKPDAYIVRQDTLLSVPAPGVLGNDSDPDGEALGAFLAVSPVHGTLNFSPFGFGNFTYEPQPGYLGTDTFTYGVNDGEATVFVQVTLNVAPVGIGSPPVTAPDIYGLRAGTTLQENVLLNDFDDEGDVMEARLLSGSAHLDAIGNLTFKAPGAFSATYTFQYEAGDGNSWAPSENITVKVLAKGSGQPPKAAADHYVKFVDWEPLKVEAPGLLANDTDLEGDGLLATAGLGPAHGVVEVDSLGGFEYLPDAGFIGLDTFRYHVSDGNVSVGADVFVTVAQPGSGAPPKAIRDDFITYNGATVLTVDPPGVLANDTDFEGDTLAAVLENSTSNGEVLLTSAGYVRYVADPTFTGIDSFTYRATDGNSMSAIATAYITVYQKGGGTPPQAVNDSYWATSGVALHSEDLGVLINDSDPEGDALTVAVWNAPSQGTVSLSAAGNFVYTSNAGFVGTDSFSYRTTDGSLWSQPATVTITVMAPGTGLAPVASDDIYLATMGTALSIGAPGLLLNDADPEGDTITAWLRTEPQHGTVTIAPAGGFVYEPEIGFSGSDSFEYRVTDGSAWSAPATVTVVVMPKGSGSPPTVGPDAFWTTQGVALSIPAPGVLVNDTDAQGDAMTAWPLTSPAHGTLSLSPSGAFVYTPTSGYIGSDSFTYRATDGNSYSQPATVSITVMTKGSGAAPSAADDTFWTTIGIPLNIAAPGVLANDSDVDADAIIAWPLTSPTHGTLSLSPSGGFVYTPEPGYMGMDSFTYRATDGNSYSQPATVDITVMTKGSGASPIAANDSYWTTTGVPLSVAGPGVLANDSDAEGNNISSFALSSPAHGSLKMGSNGGFVYTPAPGYSGIDSFTYRVTDGNTWSQLATVQLTVMTKGSGAAPVAANDAYWTTTGVALNIAAPGVLANDSDANGDAIIAWPLTAPAHGTLALATSGSFVYTPTPGYTGNDSFTYRTTDGNTYSQPAIVSITVMTKGSGAAPIAANDAYWTTTGVALNIAAPGLLANDSDANGDAIIAWPLTSPTHGTLALATSGGFVYTPTPGYTGSDSFTYRATDGNSYSQPATVNITVMTKGSGAAPVAANDAFWTTTDVALNIAAPGVLANDSDANGDAIIAWPLASPAHGTLALATSGGFVYTPTPGYTGSDSFTYRATDGNSYSQPAIVSITVMTKGSGAAPVAANDAFWTTTDVALNIAAPGVLANDSDANGDAIIAWPLTSPAHGTVSLSPSGALVYVPNSGYTGGDSFTYRATDGNSWSQPATVNLTVMVKGSGAAPVAANDAYLTNTGVALTLPAPGVLANDTDAEGDEMAAFVLSPPAHGTLTLSSNGAFVYAPAAGYVGSDSFTYRATDGNNWSQPATVNLAVMVKGSGAAPIAANDAYLTNTNVAFSLPAPGVLANDTDAEGDAIAAFVLSSPSHGTLALSPNGALVYTPAAGYVGSDSFTYRATDGNSWSQPATVNLTVMTKGSGAPPLAQDDAYWTTTGVALSVPVPGVLANDTDPENDAMAAFAVSEPEHGTLALSSSGAFVYTPAPEYTGGDSFKYRVSDGNAWSTPVVVQLTVMTKGSGAAPVAIGDSYATTKNTTLVVAAPGVLTNDTDAESDGLGAFVDTPPIHGALTLSSNGGFTYTPFTDYLGPDAFTYRVTDGNSWSQLVTVALTVATSGPIDPQSDAIFRDGFEAPPLPSVAKAAFVSQADDAHSGHFVIDAATMQGALAIEPWAAWTLSSPNGSAIAAVELRELGGGYEVRAAVSTEGRWAYSAWTQIERDELIFVDWSSPYYASDSVNLEVRTSLSSRRIKLGSD